MNKDKNKPGKFRVIAFNWHPPHDVITAGGFVRIREILKKIPQDIELHIYDNYPSILSDVNIRNVNLIEYRLPKALRSLEARAFFLERIIEWILSFLYMSASAILLRVKGTRFDAVYIPSSEQVPALAAGILAKKLFNVPLAACNMNIDYYSSLAKRLVVVLHNQADYVITLSEDLKRTLVESGIKVPVLINGVGLDTNLIRSTGALDVEGKTGEAIFIGRHSPTKGIFDLVKIWSIVTKSIPSATLIMVGSCSPGIRAKLNSLIDKHGLRDRVVLKGTVDDETKYKLVKESKICLFPSYLEGWAIVPQEALACGLPVVAYDLPVYEENIKPCGAVITVPIGEYEAMADKAIELLTGGKYDEYRDIGPPFVEKFRWDDVAEREFRLIRVENESLNQ